MRLVPRRVSRFARKTAKGANNGATTAMDSNVAVMTGWRKTLIRTPTQNKNMRANDSRSKKEQDYERGSRQRSRIS